MKYPSESTDLEIYEPLDNVRLSELGSDTLSEASSSNIQKCISTTPIPLGKSSAPKESSKFEHGPYSPLLPRSHTPDNQNRSHELPAASCSEITSLEQEDIERQSPRLEGLTAAEWLANVDSTSKRVYIDPPKALLELVER